MLNAAITVNTGGPIQTQLLTLIFTTLIIVGLSALYFCKQRKQDVTKLERKGIVLFMDAFIKGTDKLVADVMGIEFRWFTPYALYLFMYIGIGNLMSLFGWEPPITSYSVTLSIGLITFIGIYICGSFYQKWRILLRYLKNPLEVITQFAPLISLTFRIFGNLTAGSTIIFLFFTLTTNLTKGASFIGYVDLIGALISPILSLYFDIFDGLVQTYIFTLLTLAYIGLEASHVPIKKEKKRWGGFSQIFAKIKGNKDLYNKNLDLLRGKVEIDKG